MKKLFIILGLIVVLTGCETLGQTAQRKPEPSKRVEIVAFGDFMLHRPQLRAAQTGEGYDFKPIFRYLTPYIQEADIAMINLETTLTDGSNGYTTYPVFSSPKEVARDFKELGFDIISVSYTHLTLPTILLV